MTKSRRLEEMRKAFSQRDIQVSALAHSSECIAQDAKEQHGGASDLLIGNVYGGPGWHPYYRLVPNLVAISFLSWALLLADGFAMAIGAFLSSKSEKEYYQREWQREAWESPN